MNESWTPPPKIRFSLNTWFFFKIATIKAHTQNSVSNCFKASTYRFYKTVKWNRMNVLSNYFSKVPKLNCNLNKFVWVSNSEVYKTKKNWPACSVCFDLVDNRVTHSDKLIVIAIKFWHSFKKNSTKTVQLWWSRFYNIRMYQFEREFWVNWVCSLTFIHFWRKIEDLKTE